MLPNPKLEHEGHRNKTDQNTILLMRQYLLNSLYILNESYVRVLMFKAKNRSGYILMNKLLMYLTLLKEKHICARGQVATPYLYATYPVPTQPWFPMDH